MRCRMFYVLRYESRSAKEYERCASTSNRNFEGRQDKGPTHLVSPIMAAAALEGKFMDVREI